jgi:hypothetical protein
MASPLDVELERNHIRRQLSPGAKFNSLLEGIEFEMNTFATERSCLRRAVRVAHSGVHNNVC